MADRAAKPSILITGASGLIGTKLIDAFSPRYQIIGLDIDCHRDQNEKAKWVKCDLTDDESVSAALSKARQMCAGHFASVIHLAAYYDFSGEPNPMYEELTVEGTRRLLRSLSDLEVEQFVFSSSLLVMEPVPKGEKLDEFSPTRAEWDYPDSKLMAEDVIDHEKGDIPVVILRIAGVYDENCHSVPIAEQISRIHQKKLEGYLFPGDPSHGQSFVHLADLIDCFVKTVQCRHDLGEKEIFLIGEPDILSYEDLQERLGKLIHGEEWPTIPIPKLAAKAGAWVRQKVPGQESFIKPWMIDLADDHCPVAIDHAFQKLGWKPRHRLADTIEEMVGRLYSDPKAWYEKNLPHRTR